MNWEVLIAGRDCANKQFLKEHDKMTLIKDVRGEDCPEVRVLFYGAFKKALFSG